MTVGPLSVVRCADSDSKKPHNLMMGDELIACLTDHMATRIEAQLAGSAPNRATVEGDDWNITVVHDLDGWYLEQDGNPGSYLLDSEGGALFAAIERWRQAGTLRIVDVGGAGLPRWPDLTDLTAAVDEYRNCGCYWHSDCPHVIRVAVLARDLCRPDPATGSETK